MVLVPLPAMLRQPIDVLAPEQLDAVHDRAMTILEEIGVEVTHDAGRALLASHGQAVDGTRVRLDRDWIARQVALAPASFRLQGRNPARGLTIGGGSMALTPSGGSPFVSDLERGRREGTIGAHDELARMAHASDVIGVLQAGTCEASDLPDTSRHLDMEYSLLRHSDKPYIAYGTSGPRARDSVALAAIACGGLDAIASTPAILGIVNPNSPLVWDHLMVDALMAWGEAGQPVVITPFLLAGATAPVSIAAGLAIQVAEALSGIALLQAVRPGSPCMFGSFFSGVDMRSGGPALGMPESVLATIAGGQIARRYGVPYRGGGGLCSANAVDAQAAYETSMALWATFSSGADLVVHAAGWLEGGLTTSYEKLALDLEVLRMFRRLPAGIDTSDEWFALDTIREEGPGGMFLGSLHTYKNYREQLFMSPLFRSQAFPTWTKQGSRRADEQATVEWRRLLDSYEDPGIDPALDEELRAFIAGRKRELDDDA
jgi:trimethylamine--corrinoid protein Co-methyltransferase